MNYFLNQSIVLTNQRDYLDQLFRVYPMSPDNIREIGFVKWQRFEKAFIGDKQNEIIKSLFDFELFPIKGSYIAYLRQDKSVVEKNPLTIARICGRLKKMGVDKIYESLSQPKEANRQVGLLFERWVNSGTLGLESVSINDFLRTKYNAILNASDSVMKHYAKEYLGYEGEKGLDFIARFNGKIVISEAEFLTDSGGHQNAQLEDALQLLKCPLKENVVKVTILDRVCYIQNKSKMNTMLCQKYGGENILSALLLRDFLYSL